MARHYEENREATLSLMAAYILENAPRGMRKYDRSRLQTAIEIPEVNVTGIEFQRANGAAKVDLHVNTSSWDHEIRQDADGNEWREQTLEVSINYPSHGSTDPATALLRAQLIQEVAMFAAELKAAFSAPFWSLYTTKAQREEFAAKSAESKRIADGVAAGREALKQNKGMKVGQTVHVTIPEGVQNGTYPFEVLDRRYTLAVASVSPYRVTLSRGENGGAS